MVQYTQIIGEEPYYQQDVINDTIVSASWAVDLDGPVLSGVVTTSTYSKVLMTQAIPGVFVLSVTLTLASGQIRIGQARINVVQVEV